MSAKPVVKTSYMTHTMQDAAISAAQVRSNSLLLLQIMQVIKICP